MIPLGCFDYMRTGAYLFSPGLPGANSHTGFTSERPSAGIAISDEETVPNPVSVSTQTAPPGPVLGSCSLLARSAFHSDQSPVGIDDGYAK